MLNTTPPLARSEDKVNTALEKQGVKKGVMVAGPLVKQSSAPAPAPAPADSPTAPASPPAKPPPPPTARRAAYVPFESCADM